MSQRAPDPHPALAAHAADHERWMAAYTDRLYGVARPDLPELHRASVESYHRWVAADDAWRTDQGLPPSRWRPNRDLKV